jgi:hypothetical protein
MSAATSVTCVVTAYNHERFVAEAVDSALGQDYPPELLDVVVVNDGSTDGTRALLDARFASEPRVTLIHQDNEGFVRAMNRAIGAATGELIAILDGDDMWPADKLRRQVALLDARLEVGLVHGDMEVVSAEGATVHASFFAYSRFEVARGRVLAKLIRQNFVAGGASVVRTSLRHAFHPIPEELIYPDWYIAARVAECAEIDHVDGSVNRYRMHDSNMGLGGTGRKFFSDMRNNVRIQRWMLGHLDTSGEPLAELLAAAETMVARGALAALELDCRPTQVLPVSDGQRAAACELALAAEETFDAGKLDAAARTWLRALADDPWNGAARAGLAVAVARRGRQPSGPETRAAVVVAFADELIAEPGLLAAYASAVDGAADATLLIQAPVAGAQGLGEALGRAAALLGLDGPAAADLLLFPCDDMAALLAAPVRAVYTRRSKPSALAAVPRVDDSDLDRLRALIAA